VGESTEEEWPTDEEKFEEYCWECCTECCFEEDCFEWMCSELCSCSCDCDEVTDGLCWESEEEEWVEEWWE